MRRATFLLLFSVLLSSSLWAQQTGASLTGHVTDPSGAAVVRAKITITNVNTNSVYTTETDSAGIYQIPFITVGTYTLTAEMQGFKKYVQAGITLIIDQKATVDIRLELGAVAQEVTVTANAPLLQVESADRGYQVDNPRLAVLPMGNLNTFESTYNAAGETVYGTSALELELGQYAIGAMSSAYFNGGLGGNNYMEDGVAGMCPGTTPSNCWNPIDDAVQEVSTQTTMYDAQYGWSSGGAINTITKGGTNQFHGNAYEYIDNTVFNAAAYGDNISATPRDADPTYFDIYGFSVGGPIIKNKLFGFVAWQTFRSVSPQPFDTQVPTAAEAQGNFSGLYTGSTQTQQVLIYDPLTTTLCPAAVAWCNGLSGVYARQTFSAEYGTNNTIPSARLNPVALNVLKLIPPPNAANGWNDNGNFTQLPGYRKETDVNPQASGRADLNLSDKTHAFFRYALSALAEYGYFYYSTPSYTDPADTSTHYPLFRNEQAYVLQVVHTFNPTTVLEVRTGLSRYENNAGGNEGVGYNLASLGFSSTFVSQASAYFPAFNWSGYEGAGTSGPTGFVDNEMFSNDVVLAKTSGRHNMKFGFQNYESAYNSLNPGSTAGVFNFTGVMTTANPLAQTSITGNSIADFVLGYANSGDIQVQLSPSFMMHQYSLFAQDDFHVSRKLTVNFGLRWDYQGAVTERFNAQLAGFCTTCASPVQVPGMTLLGGPLFAGVAPTPRGLFNPKYSNFGPRLGFAYDVGHNTVVRGGYGMIYANNFDMVGVAPGFSQTTNMLTSVLTGIPNPAVTLQDPYPTGVLTPVGSKYGLAANIGNSIAFPDRDKNIPRTQQFSLEVQHQFGRNLLASVGYVGTLGSRLPVNQSLNYIPLTYLPYTYSGQPNPTGLTAGQLNSSVPNPFTAVPSTSPYYSIMKGTYLSPANATIPQYYLTYTFPQFSAVTEEYEPIGSSSYNSFQAELNKRMSGGVDFTLNYTFAKLMQGNIFNNPQDARPVWTIGQYDNKMQVKANVAWYLPFGTGRKWLATATPVVRHLVEGWKYSMVLQAEAGFPIATPTGVEPTGAPEALANPTLNLWFNTCTQTLTGTLIDCPSGITTPAWKQTEPDQLKTWSPYLNRLRGTDFHNPEMVAEKATKIKERYSLRIGFMCHNCFNTNQWLKGPNVNSASTIFGNIAPYQLSPNSDPRQIYPYAKFEF